MYHDDPHRFRAALQHCQALNGFTSLLIEKDYYCSVLLLDFAGPFTSGLVFKGGTCLSKVHSDFFRLSEDLDFGISLSTDSSRSKRRKAVTPFKGHFATIPDRLPCFRIADELLGYNNSAQYNGTLAYKSIVTGEDEFVKVEVSLREPLVLQSKALIARTMLLDPDTNQPSLPPVQVMALSLHEAYAEKIRAALTRRPPAIRDFFDIDKAVQQGLLELRDEEILDLLATKLAVPGNGSIDITEAKVLDLTNQLEGQLRPVLRATDYEGFQLQRVFDLLRVVEQSRPWIVHK